MYNNRNESHKDKLYTSRIIFMVLSIGSIFFVVASFDKALDYVAISLSPENTQAV